MTRLPIFIFFALFAILFGAGCAAATSTDDGGAVADTGGEPVDTGSGSTDAGQKDDTGTVEDTGAVTDAGEPEDAGTDAGVKPDAGVDAGQPVDAGTDAGGDIDGGGVTAGTCDALKEGLNEIDVDGTKRSFILNLPDNAPAGGPWPVVFNWHGLGDTAENMAGMLGYLVNDPGYPFIQVAPNDTGFMVAGYADMNWDVFVVDAAKNIEARLFDETLVCLKKNFSIDEGRVHSTGFSIGSICTDMLGTVRGDKLASLATFSGGYFSNPDDVASLGFLSNMVNWPAPAHTNGYGQVILYGGDQDTYSLGVAIKFYEFAVNDTTYLNGLGHDVVLCNHGQGHSAPAPGFGGDQIIEFFSKHPRGTVDSPYKAGLPADYPAYCEFKGKP